MFLSKAFRGLQPRTPGDFSLAGKVTRVRAGKAREVPNRMAPIREKKCFSPTRPAMGESVLHRPDALAQRI